MLLTCRPVALLPVKVTVTALPRRPLRVVQDGKADGKDPLREARRFTEAEWRQKCAFVAALLRPLFVGHPTWPHVHRWTGGHKAGGGSASALRRPSGAPSATIRRQSAAPRPRNSRRAARQECLDAWGCSV